MVCVSRSRRVFLRFQSLSGFLMRCDAVDSVYLSEEIEVSIPIGFSDAL